MERKLKKKIIEKQSAYVQNIETGGIKISEIDKSKQNLSSLQDSDIKKICDTLNILEKYLGKPQDIEFAILNKKLYLLQTRPITAIISNEINEEYILWDNSNIIESYPGVTTPLTYSFINEMYEAVYRQFVGLLGVTDKNIEKHASVFANTLGLIRGRVYYNLLSWYKMLAMLPGFSINAGFMENMMGVKEKFELKEDYRLSKTTAWYRIFLMLCKMIYLQKRLPAERKIFLKQLDETIERYSRMDFSKLSLQELKNLYKEFEQTLLKKWKAPLVNDFFAMIWFGVLQKQTSNYFSETHPTIHNDLLCGSKDIISTEPIHRTIAIATEIAQQPDAYRLFIENNIPVILNKLNEAKYSEIKKAINQHIERFGERCVGELKLETISYSQDQGLFIRILKSYIEQGIVSKEFKSDIETQLRTEAEIEIDKIFKDKGLKKRIFRYILNKARDHVSNRENLRFERTRGFGMVRTMFSEIGRKMESGKIIQHHRDVFYLTMTEIFDIIENKFSENPQLLIQKRKEEFENYKNTPAPAERFFTYGTNFSDEFIYSKAKLSPVVGDLNGIGCCPGIVEAKVNVIMNPNETDSLHGDILVTLSTDPGWVTLFPTAAGIIVEKGSLLSHSAIVSREMGIPCIVGVTGLLQTLKTGDKVKMDGRTGKIMRVI